MPHDDFSTLFEFLSIGAYRSTIDGRQLRANPALVRLNGFTTEAEQIAHVHDIATEWYVDPGRRAEFIRRLNTDGQVTGFVSEVRRYRGGQRLWVSENAHLVRDRDGTVLYCEGTVEDITERLLGERALQRSEQNLRELATHLPGALYRLVIHPDGGRHIDYISDGVRDLLGLDPERVMREAGAIRAVRHPDDRQRVEAELDAANAAGLPLTTEYRIRLPDGRERWIQQTSSAVVSQPHALVRIGVLLDITERKQSEARLRASDERWKLALDSIGDGVWETNLVSGERLLSRRGVEMYGFDEGDPEALPEALDRRIHPDDLPAVMRSREALLAGGTPGYVSEHRVQHKSGQWVWVLSRGTVIERAADSRPLRLIGTLTDITAAKQAEALRYQRDRAAAADMAKSQFLSRVSHELRTPLNAILGFSQLLELEVTEQPRQLSWIRQVLSSGQHLLGLMDDILDLSSAQTGQLPMNPEALDLRGVVQEVLAMLTGSAQAAGIEVLDELPRSPSISVRADGKRLKQILANLLSNAIKYNQRGGWVRLRAAAQGGQVVLSVADNGIGLDPSQLDRLFQPFERLGAQRGPVPGTGLGLALSRQLAQAMGGDIDVQCRLGHGSVFRLLLPAG